MHQAGSAMPARAPGSGCANPKWDGDPALSRWPQKRPRREWQHPAGWDRSPQGDRGLASALTLPTEDVLSELVISGMQPLVQEIKERFTSSPVSARPAACAARARSQPRSPSQASARASGISV